MRARSVKPGLFKNEILGRADPLYTVIFEGVWCMADRDGRLEDRPARLHVEVNPYRSIESTEQALDWLVKHRFLQRYEHGGNRFMAVPNFARHQMPHHREKPSSLPPPPKFQVNQEDVPAPGQARNWVGSAPLTPDSGLLTPDSGLHGLSASSPGRAPGQPSASPGLDQGHARARELGNQDWADALATRWSGYLTGNGLSVTEERARELAGKFRALGEARALATVQHAVDTGSMRLVPVPVTVPAVAPKPVGAGVTMGWMDALKAAYPAGQYRGVDWLNAERAVNRLLDDGEATPDQLVQAARDYAAQKAAQGKLGTQFVLAPSKFYANGEWRGPFPAGNGATHAAPARTFAQVEYDDVKRMIDAGDADAAIIEATGCEATTVARIRAGGARP